MNKSLSDAAGELIKRAKLVGKTGKPADRVALNQLVKDTGGRIPAWYVELLVGFPLAGLEIGWQSDYPTDGYDGIGWMLWNAPAGIRSESLECYPGLAILENGWINVASDSAGSGDPYFIPTDKGDDPPVFQIYHDIGEDAEVILAEGCRLVAPSLSELFQHAKL